MALTVRLDPKLERELEAICTRDRVTKSEIVIRLLRAHLARSRKAGAANQAATRLRLVGAFASGTGDLAASHSTRIKEVLRGKRSG
jgi:predicted transcriptional regulator